MGKRFLYLVRHGQNDRESAPRDQLGNGLTDLGRMQAELTAQRLSKLPITVIHHSSLRRAAETASIIAAAVPAAPLRPARLLHECIPYLPAEFIEWYTNNPADEIYVKRQKLAPELSPWLDLWSPHTEWKLIEQGMHQAQRAFEKYFIPTHRSQRHEIIVCHGNILRYFVCCALRLAGDGWIHIDVHNCGISEIVVESSSRVKLVSHNDTGHLPYELRSYI